ncbi:MAG: 4-phosphoerythronate dehydrogenase [Holophagales bacterium]|nr:MAG: 4-phosphoerythronate dehydrogenase [Holophagales bacterium]
MRFVVDSQIPFAVEALSAHGEVVALPGSAIAPEALVGADALWVRSTVRVDAELLAACDLRFVGTVTSGVDHLDIASIERRGIAWAAAPGSNAGAVQRWWAAALTAQALRDGVPLSRRRVGVVGVGHVGRRVAAFARAFGGEVLLCDPPRARAEGAAGFLPLRELLSRVDLLTLHVPLTRGGSDPTWHLIGGRELATLGNGALLVNCARGSVVDSAALLAERGRIVALLDVFEGEPEVATESVTAAALATPHLAGSSLDGKIAASRTVYEATCAALHLTPAWPSAAVLAPPEPHRLEIQTNGLSDEAIVVAALAPFHSLAADDAALRRIAGLPPGERGAAFERHRTASTPPREPIGVEVALAPARPVAAAALAALGMIPESDANAARSVEQSSPPDRPSDVASRGRRS